MTRTGLLAASLLLGGALLGGCGNECNSAIDCAATEVCYKAVCTPAAARYLSCNSDMDCNPGGGNELECVAGACRVAGTATNPDAGFPDSGTNTSTTTDAGP
jgi:hypothetical protein